MGMLKFVMFRSNIVISCLVINLVFINTMLNTFYILFYLWKFIIWFSVNKFDLNALNNSRISRSRKLKSTNVSLQAYLIGRRWYGDESKHIDKTFVSKLVGWINLNKTSSQQFIWCKDECKYFLLSQDKHFCFVV